MNIRDIKIIHNNRWYITVNDLGDTLKNKNFNWGKAYVSSANQPSKSYYF